MKSEIKRLLARLLWWLAQPLTSFNQMDLRVRWWERLGYTLWEWSLSLHNPAGDIGTWPLKGQRRLLDDLDNLDEIDHPGGHIEPYGTGR